MNSDSINTPDRHQETSEHVVNEICALVNRNSNNTFFFREGHTLSQLTIIRLLLPTRQSLALLTFVIVRTLIGSSGFFGGLISSFIFAYYNAELF